MSGNHHETNSWLLKRRLAEKKWFLSVKIFAASSDVAKAVICSECLRVCSVNLGTGFIRAPLSWINKPGAKIMFSFNIMNLSVNKDTTRLIPEKKMLRCLLKAWLQRERDVSNNSTPPARHDSPCQCPAAVSSAREPDFFVWRSENTL